MRRFLLVLLVLPFVSAGSCDSDSPTAPAPDAPSSVELPAEVTLAIGDAVLVQPLGVEVAFASVLEDSRCPVDVVCIRAGRAVVAVQVAAAQEDASRLELVVGGPPSSALGLRVAATALAPRPRLGEEIPPQDYRLDLSLD